MMEKDTKKKFCIFVPTRNHPDLIQYFLEKTVADLQKYSIDLWIYDTSDDDATKKIVASFFVKQIHYITMEINFDRRLSKSYWNQVSTQA